jgi:hypothetical protein
LPGARAAAKALLELRVDAPAFDGLGEGRLHRLVHTLPLCAGERLGVGGELVREAHREVFRHGDMIPSHRHTHGPWVKLTAFSPEGELERFPSLKREPPYLS